MRISVSSEGHKGKVSSPQARDNQERQADQNQGNPEHVVDEDGEHNADHDEQQR